MARPRKVKNQRTIFDILLENPELADVLDHITRFEPAAKELRDARQTFKTIIHTQFPEVINAVLEDGSPQFVVVDNYRFTFREAERPAGKKPAAAGVTTLIEIFALEP